MNFIEDKELNLKKEGNDLLNGKSYSETLKQIIQNTPKKGTFCIGLFGEWGSGKSSIIKTVKDDITKNKKEYGNTKFVIYDAWKYVNDSFRRMFLLNLQEELGLERSNLMEKFYCNKSVEQKIELKFSSKHFNFTIIISLLLLIVSSILMSKLDNNVAINATFVVSLVSFLTTLIFKCFNELKTSSNIPYLFAPEQFEDCFMDIISKALRKNSLIKAIKHWVLGKCENDKLVIVIDNIDRCNCETAYELLTNIKNFMGNYDGLIFIIPIDDKALKKHLINDKNSDKDAEEFLRKFFNVELRIKPLENVELFDFANSLNKKHQMNLTPDTINIVANEYATNPRRIIQLFNNLSAELNILSQNCDEKFLKENQSIICKALIIREEWSEYYNMIKKDNKLLKVKNYEPNSNEDTKKYKELNIFLNKTYCLTTDTKLPVIEKILSNSNAFHEFPKTIIDSVASFNIKQLIEYTQTSSENRELSIKYLLDKLEKSVNKQTYRSETVQMFVSLLAINKNNKLTSTNNKKIQTAIFEQIKNFLTHIPEEYFLLLTQYINDLGPDNYLMEEISQYMEERLKEDDGTDNFAYKLYKLILLNCNDIKKLRNTFKIWYSISDTNLPDLDIKNKIQSVLTDELIIFILSGTTNTNEDSWVFDDIEYLAQYGKLSERQKDLIFTFFNSKTSAFNGSNDQELLNSLRFITKMLKYVKINKNKAFMNFYENTFRQQQVSYQQRTILQTVTNEDDLRTIIDFLILTYISGYNTPATQDKLRVLFDTYSELQAYILASIKNICDNGIQIFPLQYIVFKTSEISETSLFLLSKIVKEKDDKGEYHIEDSSVKTKIDYLVKNLTKEEYNVQINSFFENNIDDSRIKELLIQTISSANRETIVSLSLKLQSNAFDKICENIQLYKNEKSLLEAIATSKTKKHISALTQLIKENLIAKNEFEYWKELYEKIDEKNIPAKDKKIIQTVFDAELEDEKEQTI
jgi:hypothetical protein